MGGGRGRRHKPRCGGGGGSGLIHGGPPRSGRGQKGRKLPSARGPCSGPCSGPSGDAPQGAFRLRGTAENFGSGRAPEEVVESTPIEPEVGKSRTPAPLPLEVERVRMSGSRCRRNGH